MDLHSDHTRGTSMDSSIIKLGDGGDKETPGSNEEALGAQCPLTQEDGQPISSGTRPLGEAPKDPNVEPVLHPETRERGRTRQVSSRPGPRCAKEERKSKESQPEEKKKKAEARRKKREMEAEGRGDTSLEDPEADSFIRKMPRVSSTSTTRDVSEGVLGDIEDPPLTTKGSSREVSPMPFPKWSVTSICGTREKGNNPTKGEYMTYLKAKQAANEARRAALDLDEEEKVSRTGLAAKIRL